ncbi:MAG TPA: hypothetical protein VNV66_13615 [Pilimelia sp.]|nr:hypothetical protein [Pilimelia sp.]
MERAGGIAGIREVVTIQPDGRWQRDDGMGHRRTGVLAAARRDQLARLLRADLGGPADPDATCHDGFRYTVRYDGAAASATACDRGRRAALFAVLDLVSRETGI